MHVEVTGSGPALLLIPGGTGDAATFFRLALPERTLIAYDRRGFSRSAGDEGGGDYDRDVEDAAALIEGQADVFGSSSGAIVGLGLAARYPEKVRRLVAHEPPLAALVEDGAAVRAGFEEVVAVYREHGAAAAMERFGEVTGLGSQPPLPPRQALPADIVAMLDRMAGNVGFWIEGELRRYTAIVPDLDALAGRVVVAVGDASGEQFPARAARALAARLGTSVEEFPGGHTGYIEEPAPFAKRLREVLA
ncbi:alpha/beta fold hydrolase [Dactylosporangium sp. CS-033363]|uniref:alpha/beta fold hydrolase n=1 Tax=Dactylosporangium sp. CS-033363 TaxID=3239935 RepID=UPI003D8F5A8A